MKLSNSQQCRFAWPSRQTMTFTNSCDDHCKRLGLFDMISVIFRRFFIASAVDRCKWSCENERPCDDQIRAIGKSPSCGAEQLYPAGDGGKEMMVFQNRSVTLSVLPDVSKRPHGLPQQAIDFAHPGYCAWGCFRTFGWGRGSAAVSSAGNPSGTRPSACRES